MNFIHKTLILVYSISELHQNQLVLINPFPIGLFCCCLIYRFVELNQGFGLEIKVSGTDLGSFIIQR